MMAVLELRSLESGGIIGSGMTDTRWKSLRDAYGYCNGQQDMWQPGYLDPQRSMTKDNRPWCS